jgi:hypothetical protein
VPNLEAFSEAVFYQFLSPLDDLHKLLENRLPDVLRGQSAATIDAVNEQTARIAQRIEDMDQDENLEPLPAPGSSYPGSVTFNSQAAGLTGSVDALVDAIDVTLARVQNLLSTVPLATKIISPPLPDFPRCVVDYEATDAELVRQATVFVDQLRAAYDDFYSTLVQGAQQVWDLPGLKR